MKHILILFLSIYVLFPSIGKSSKNFGPYLKSLRPGGSSMIFIPKGEYFTGEKRSTCNSPLIKRSFKSFYIDIHPVSNIQFLIFLEKTNYKPSGKFDRSYAGKNPFDPATGVTREDAAMYAKYAGKRLPSEWEWEIAARALKKDYQPFLSMIYKEKRGIFYNVERKNVSQIFSTPPNEIGFYDHIGNVFEWTTGDYPMEMLTGRNKYAQKIGVIRGGAWTNIRNDVKYSTRIPFPVNRSLKWLGFRCVKDLKK